MPEHTVGIEISMENAKHLVTILELVLDEGGLLPQDARLIETLVFDLRSKLEDLNA